MRLQSQILQTLRAPEAQARLGRIVAHGACESRAALGHEACAQFGFVDTSGSAQLAGCLKALRVLETERRITLPAARPHRCRPAPRCLDAPVPAPVEVPPQVRDVEGLRQVVMEDEVQRRVWNTLPATEHPQGTTTFVGCQLRYLLGSAHGWLGAVGFSASALRLRARDARMRWSDAQRTAHLHRVVCLNRFLIRPAMCWGEWRRTSRPATTISRSWWRPSLRPRATEPASRRQTSRASAAPRDVGTATAPTTMPAR